jgi:hypothetical protein
VVFLYCGLGIPHTLQVTNLPCLTASCAKFLRTVYPRGGTSIMLPSWVYTLMEKIVFDCPGSKCQKCVAGLSNKNLISGLASYPQRLKNKLGQTYSKQFFKRLIYAACAISVIPTFILSGSYSTPLVSNAKITLTSFPHKAISDCIFVKGFSVRVRLRWCNDRNSSFVARIGIIVW